MCNNGNMPDQPSQLPDTSSPLSSGKRVAMPPVATEPAVPSKAEVDTVAEVGSAVPMQQARDDDHLVRLWLHGKRPNTRDAYGRDVQAFVDFAESCSGSRWGTSRTGPRARGSRRARRFDAGPEVLRRQEPPLVRPPARLPHLVRRRGRQPAQGEGHASPSGSSPRPPSTASSPWPTRLAESGPVHRPPERPRSSGSSTPRGGRVSELAALRWRDVRRAVRSSGAGPQGRSPSSARAARRGACSSRPTRGPSLTEHRERESASGFGEADAPRIPVAERRDRPRPATALAAAALADREGAG